MRNLSPDERKPPRGVNSGGLAYPVRAGTRAIQAQYSSLSRVRQASAATGGELWQSVRASRVILALNHNTRAHGPTVRSRSCLKGSSRKGFYLAPGWWSIQRCTPYAQVPSHVQKEPPRGLSGTPKRPRADSVEGR